MKKLLKKRRTIMAYSLSLFLLLINPPVFAYDCPKFIPQHEKLFEKYQSGYEILSKYADGQGFKGKCENRLVILHEIVHIDSAIHGGYYTWGDYVGPYLFDLVWKNFPIKNKDIIDLKTSAEYHGIGSNVARYLRDTPDNSLGNILDELNAYTQTLLYAAPEEKGSIEKQIGNLKGYLAVLEVYLRILEEQHPKDFIVLTRVKAGRVLRLMVRNAWTTLAKAGVQKKDVLTTRAGKFISLVEIKL